MPLVRLLEPHRCRETERNRQTDEADKDGHGDPPPRRDLDCRDRIEVAVDQPRMLRPEASHVASWQRTAGTAAAWDATLPCARFDVRGCHGGTQAVHVAGHLASRRCSARDPPGQSQDAHQQPGGETGGEEPEVACQAFHRGAAWSGPASGLGLAINPVRVDHRHVLARTGCDVAPGGDGRFGVWCGLT
jgi:hypothetical protein